MRNQEIPDPGRQTDRVTDRRFSAALLTAAVLLVGLRAGGKLAVEDPERKASPWVMATRAMTVMLIKAAAVGAHNAPASVSAGLGCLVYIQLLVSSQPRVAPGSTWAQPRCLLCGFREII